MALFLSLCLFIFLMSSASHLHQYTNTALDNTAKELSLPISNWYFLIKYCPFLFSYQNRPAALIQLTALLWNTLFFLWPWYHTFLFFTHWFQPSFSVSLLWDFFLSFQYWCSLGGPMPSLFYLAQISRTRVLHLYVQFTPISWRRPNLLFLPRLPFWALPLWFNCLWDISTRIT